MTINQLELRIASLERKIARLADKADLPAQADMNAWIDQIHGTFPNDAAYRHAAKSGRQWRELHRRSRTPESRKASTK